MPILKKIFIRSLILLIPMTSFAYHCNYNETEQAKYIKQQYQYKKGNINSPCVKVFTITDYRKGDKSKDIVELPTNSSWVLTENGECRCIDLNQPESLWNKTFPKNKYTTKDILVTLKSYANKSEYEIDEAKTIVLTKIKNNNKNETIEVSELIDSNLLKNNNDNYITHVNKNNNTYKNNKELIKLKNNNNNVFITNSSNYLQEIKIKEGDYMITFKTTPDINMVQVFDDNFNKLKEFRLFELNEIEVKFFINIKKDTNISFMGLNPIGKGYERGIFDIKITKLRY